MPMISLNRMKYWITHISNRNICNLWRRKVMITLPFIRIINSFIWVFFIKNALKYVHTCIKIALSSPDTKINVKEKIIFYSEIWINWVEQSDTYSAKSPSTDAILFFNVKQTKKSFNLTCQHCGLMYYFVLLIAKLEQECFFSWLG